MTEFYQILKVLIAILFKHFQKRTRLLQKTFFKSLGSFYNKTRKRQLQKEKSMSQILDTNDQMERIGLENPVMFKSQ